MNGYLVIRSNQYGYGVAIGCYACMAMVCYSSNVLITLLIDDYWLLCMNGFTWL